MSSLESSILIIDDDQMTGKLVSKILSEYKGIFLAFDLKQGKELIQKENPSVVLLDWNLPDGEGTDLLREIDSQAIQCSCQVIMLTSHKTPADLEKAFSLGAFDFISKPANPTELRARVANAVKINSQKEQLLKLSRLDSLTGINNRRYFIESAFAEIEIAKRYGRSITLALLDVDFFKRINDSFGHPTGDAVLQEICAIVDENIRKSDVFARVGGEEFAIIFREIDPEGSKICCERIRKSIEKHDWVTKIAKGLTVTISVGISEYSKDLSFDEWYQNTDKGLYKAKESGRNKVVIQEINPL